MTNKIIKNIKLGLVGIVLAGSLNNLYSQNTNLDSLIKQPNIQLNPNDSLLNVQNGDVNNFLNQMREHYPEFSSEKVYSENLCINLNEKRYYVTKKNEEEGLKDLIKICNQGYEEAWLYLPEKQLWYEIGIRSDSNSTSLFEPRIKKALEENKDVKKLIFYHNHLEGGLDQPSLRDMHASIYNHLDFPDYKIVSKIIAKEGLIEYFLNHKGEKLLENMLINEEEEYVGLNTFEDVSKYFDIKCTSISLLDK